MTPIWFWGPARIYSSKLRDDSIDAGLMGLPEGATHVESQLLYEDDTFFAALAKSPRCALEAVDLGTCVDERFVSLTEGFVAYSRFVEAFRLAGFEPNVITTDDISSLMNLVRGSIEELLAAAHGFHDNM